MQVLNRGRSQKLVRPLKNMDWIPSLRSESAREFQLLETFQIKGNWILLVFIATGNSGFHVTLLKFKF